jgi:hypothetical protein
MQMVGLTEGEKPAAGATLQVVFVTCQLIRVR